ncbi:MAG: zinc-ribbon domain-containing protein [Streptosporangiaceae bacterium]
MFLIWGLRVFYRTTAQGVFYCRKCGGDRNYRLRSGRRFITVFFIPLIPLNKVGEHVQCATCKTRYVKDVLREPTTGQMQSALADGMRAAVVAMLAAGAPVGGPARQLAITTVREAGRASYDDAALQADLAKPAGSASLDTALAGLAAQLRPEAKERYLESVIRVGMADAPLTTSERIAAESIAAALGMTQAQALGVITLTEQKLV